ncbi:outer membrane autotransporter protein [Luteibacter sp. Sphag1AF]|uniref:autotransporter family protein n=1 Tax=Luteibacter sp. Sphag1AF TaxID=2587031 RepID=UPI001620E051|nr:autotransporter outer membrane beta-barrel domain-containing protein [Luteibacter sp. Sphag1AF]MBB3226594.1 outer membrane autotransporter protein [Luteibacter sp. Sphag1AF]
MFTVPTHVGAPRRALALALATLLFPTVSVAQVNAGSGQIVSPPPGNYFTTGDDEHGFWAHDGGLINSTGGAFISTSGADAYGVTSEGLDSTITVTGGDIFTSGANAFGASAQAGATVAIAGVDSSNPMRIQTMGQGAHAVRATGAGSVVTISKAEIETMADDVYGLHVTDQASATLNGNVDVLTHGAGSHALVGDGARSRITVQGGRIETEGQGAAGVAMRDGAVAILAGSTIVTGGADAAGITVTGVSSQATLSNGGIQTTGDGAHGVVAAAGARANLSSTSVTTNGNASAVSANDASVTVDNTQLLSHGNAPAIQARNGATVTVQNRSSIAVDRDGAVALQVHGGSMAPTVVNVINSELTSTTGTLITAGSGRSHVRAEDAHLHGGTTLLDAAAGADMTLQVIRSSALGDALVATGGAARISLEDNALWTGRGMGLESVNVDGSSAWALTGDSSIGALGLDGLVAFEGEPDTWSSLRVANDLGGSGGVISMRARLGDPRRLPDISDRVLIEGNVTTSGTTMLDVEAQGSGALTDSNHNGVIDASEGISLVQVSGQSRADAFALLQGYVAAGPFQYELQAFGPGEVDPTQSALAGPLNWDYRLGNRYVCQVEPCGPLFPGPDPGSDPGAGSGSGAGPGPGEGLPEGMRPAVVPQLPAYLVTPLALGAYGGRLMDTLHQRLGEIRHVVPSGDLGGEVFARYVGARQSYRTDLSFDRFGYNFRQQDNALQLGGSLLAFAADTSVLRAGWALDKGTIHVTPSAADGNSRARYDASGVSAWLTWQDESGFYADAIAGGRQFRGDVGTDLRGENVARVRGSDSFVSVELGHPFAMGEGWMVEPQVQASWQSLRTQAFTDRDGVEVGATRVGRLTQRVGMRIGRFVDPTFSPYARVDVIRNAGGRGALVAGAGTYRTAFDMGRAGNQYRVGVGATWRFARNWSLYGEGDYLAPIGSNGFRGYNATLGLRWNI